MQIALVRTRHGAVLGLLLSALATISAPSAGAAASTGSAGSITVYSGQHEQTAALLAKDFQQRTGISVRLRSADEGSLANQILLEGAASPADVFFAENPPALTVLDRKHLLAPVSRATLAHVPKRYSATDGDWVGVSGRSVALAYDRTRLQPGDLPATLQELANASWKGRVGFAPGETDFQPLITAIAALSGKPAALAWLTALKANAKVYDDNELLIAAVDRGEIETGIVDHYYWYRLRDEVGKAKLHAALHYFRAGDAGALVDVSGAAVLRSSTHAELAQRFLAYLVSTPAQTIIATSQSYEYPLGSGVVSHELLVPFARLHPPKLNAAALGDGSYPLALLRRVGLL